MTEAAPAEQAVAAEKKKRLFHRIPTSLLITLIGIALSAWLLPAFTRQWEDRRNARELKAAVATQIASATADAITAGMEVWQRDADEYAPPGARSRVKRSPLNSAVFYRRAYEDLYRLYEPWLRRKVKFDTQLRAYFPASVYNRRRAYNDVVFEMMEIASNQAQSNLTQGALWDDVSGWSKPLGMTQKQFRFDMNEMMRAVGGRAFERSNGFHGYRDIYNAVLRHQDEFIKAILASHVNGYSTTTHDLIHNLIP
jgi:hypothetical protein